MKTSKSLIQCFCGVLCLAVLPLRGQDLIKDLVPDPIPDAQIQSHITAHYDAGTAARLRAALSVLEDQVSEDHLLARRGAAKQLVEQPIDPELMYLLLLNYSSRGPLLNAIYSAESISPSLLPPLVRAMIYHAPNKGEPRPLTGGPLDPYGIVRGLKRMLDKSLGVDTPPLPMDEHWDYQTEDLVAWWQTAAAQIAANPKVSQGNKAALATLSSVSFTE